MNSTQESAANVTAGKGALDLKEVPATADRRLPGSSLRAGAAAHCRGGPAAARQRASDDIAVGAAGPLAGQARTNCDGMIMMMHCKSDAAVTVTVTVPTGTLTPGRDTLKRIRASDRTALTHRLAKSELAPRPELHCQ